MELLTTKDQLRVMLANANDKAYNHFFWVCHNGYIHIEAFGPGRTHWDMLKLIGDKLYYGLEVFQHDAGYVGLEASQDELWVDELYDMFRNPSDWVLCSLVKPVVVGIQGYDSINL